MTPAEEGDGEQDCSSERCPEYRADGIDARGRFVLSLRGWLGLLRLVRLVGMELCGEPGEGIGRWGEALASAGDRGFELRGREDAQSAGVAGGEMLLDSLPLGGWEFAVDEGVEGRGADVFG